MACASAMPVYFPQAAMNSLTCRAYLTQLRHASDLLGGGGVEPKLPPDLCLLPSIRTELTDHGTRCKPLQSSKPIFDFWFHITDLYPCCLNRRSLSSECTRSATCMMYHGAPRASPPPICCVRLVSSAFEPVIDYLLVQHLLHMLTLTKPGSCIRFV